LLTIQNDMFFFFIPPALHENGTFCNLVIEKYFDCHTIL
jgi:hypothetical protein